MTTNTKANILKRAIAARGYFDSIGAKSYMALLIYANKTIAKDPALRIKIGRIMTLDSKRILSSDENILPFIEAAVAHLKAHGWR